MNVGYSRLEWKDVNNQICPLCGKDIYINKYGNNFACIDTNCPLGHGAKELVDKIHKIFKMMS